MRVVAGLLGSSFVLAGGAVSAQESTAPPARLGFQMALRSGVAVPSGRLTGPVDIGSVIGIPHEKVSDFVSVQVAPLLVELGFKPVSNLFLGAYLGLSFGGAGGLTKELCDADRSDCTSHGLRIGLEAQYHVLPNREVNPWCGYGVGLESLRLSSSGGANGSQSVTYAGVEYAHFMGGADFRISRSLGAGPFIDFAVGKYTRVSATDGNAELFSTDVAHTALHEWFSLGARGVLFP